MAAEPTHPPVRADLLVLTPFDPAQAERIAGWVRGTREAYWLAPRSVPPITADEVLAWREPRSYPMMLATPATRVPVAYGEVNRMSSSKGEYWLGHLVVEPRSRWRGVGVRLTRALLEQAFRGFDATRVSLVVFPENLAAIACYRAAGLAEEGWEIHRFPAYGRRERLLRMAATRDTWV